MAAFDRMVKGERPSRGLRQLAMTKRCTKLGLFYTRPQKLRTSQDAPDIPTYLADEYLGIQSWIEEADVALAAMNLNDDKEHPAAAETPLVDNTPAFFTTDGAVSSDQDDLSDTESDSDSETTSSEATLVEDEEIPVAQANSPNPCVEVTSSSYPERGIFVPGGTPSSLERRQLSTKFHLLRMRLQESTEWKRRYGPCVGLIQGQQYLKCAKIWHERALQRAKVLVELWNDKSMSKRRVLKLAPLGPAAAKLDPKAESTAGRREESVARVASPLSNALSMEEWVAEEHTDGATWIWMGDRERACYATSSPGW